MGPFLNFLTTSSTPYSKLSNLKTSRTTPPIEFQLLCVFDFFKLFSTTNRRIFITFGELSIASMVSMAANRSCNAIKFQKSGPMVVTSIWDFRKSKRQKLKFWNLKKFCLFLKLCTVFSQNISAILKSFGCIF